MNPQEEKITSALESCRAVERKIQAAQQFLLIPRREGLDGCIHELDQAAILLETLVSAGPYSASPALPAAFHRLKRSAQMLRLQIGYSSTLWRGWLQRRLGTGYTEQGLPVFVDHSARSFEG